MGALAHFQRSLTKRNGNVDIGHGGVFNGGILHGGMFKTDGAGCNYDVAGLHIQINTAAGAHTDEGVCADVVQLFHGDGGRGAANAGGAYADLLAQKGTGINIILTILCHMHGIVKELCNGFAAAGVAGENAVAAYVTFDAADMKLFFQFLHSKYSFS